MTIKEKFEQLQATKVSNTNLLELVPHMEKFLQWEVNFRLAMIEKKEAYNLLADKWVFDGIYPVTEDDDIADELVGQHLCTI